ncbi:hypothetical protein ACFO1B_38870 [Dactylosporangium siamense]|uniref:Serine peptidase n=1 Tax=Dactylosporangium siamense TaxID=685454 RepID=A0A919PXJ7_9ACTN|nr:hypothetical protein [Dactylosporangium siamense]GIG50358.1 hypothetical protein Dsi01nite_083990 [Dactylosporangium siamense]
MSMTILGVHGVGNHQPGVDPDQAAATIAGWWTAALGDIPAKTVMAYYAHRLRPSRVAQGGADEPDSELEPDIYAWARELGWPDRTPQGMVTAPIRAVVSWVATTYGLDQRLTQMFVERFFRELHRYFTDAERRDAIVTGVADLVDQHQPRVVVAHSLGSVVAYEALWRRDGHPIDLFITIGSPLAMPSVVHDRLVVRDGGHRRPPRVRRWLNIADPGDVVAIPRHGLGQSFAGVEADITTAIHAFDFHRATNYLRSAKVREPIAACG